MDFNIENIDEIVEEALSTEENTEAQTVEQTAEPQTEVQEEVISVPELPRFTRNNPPVEIYTSRFTSAEWYDKMKQKEIAVLGLGGIGSYVALLVARLSPYRLFLYDDDVVEEGNMSGQLYTTPTIGLHKATAMYRAILEYGYYSSVYTFRERYKGTSSPYPIVLCGFDNMEARKIAFIKWKDAITNYDAKNCLFIDGRLAAEEFQVFCMTGEDSWLMEKYEKEWLFDDKEAEETICSYKQTSFCANMIASVMVNLLVNFITNLCEPNIPRELPFKTVYDASLMSLKTYNV